MVAHKCCSLISFPFPVGWDPCGHVVLAGQEALAAAAAAAKYGNSKREWSDASVRQSICR